MQIKQILAGVITQIHPWCKCRWLSCASWWRVPYPSACGLWKEEELQELVSCYASPNICVSGQIFIRHWIYAPSASAANNFLWTAVHRICAENFTLATREPRQTHRTFRKPSVLKNQTTARSTACLPSPKSSLLSTSSSLHSVLYIDCNELLETHAGGMVEQSCTEIECNNREPTRGVRRGRGIQDKNRMTIPRGSFPENGIVMLLICLLNTLREKDRSK